MTDLFTPIKVGNYELPNRIFMAPLSRSRASAGGIPNALMAEYYAQRASAGLIIAEAAAVSPLGMGWRNAPGCFSDAQQKGWALVTDRVHAKDGRIFLQLWHMGNLVHPDFIQGQQPVSSFPATAPGQIITPSGVEKAFVLPRALSKAEIGETRQAFVAAAKRAIAAGFDGIEIHAANGFLIDQFTRDSINQRADEYGGSVDNRLRFMLEIVADLCNAIGSAKVGIRISPTNKVWGIRDTHPEITFGRAAEKLNDFDLAYLHVLEPKPETRHFMATVGHIMPLLRQCYNGVLIANCGYTQQTGNAAIENREADAIAYGSWFISNPDLVARFVHNAPLTEPDRGTYYSDGARGYTDYPLMQY
ncbi:alkene reductase [Methylomonas sp. UP202]|uniref:alkene reductase n=1 Tax=Methylomonas sp. UP202 TaxID=3040943 RepID=UPI00247B030B|nr:alkene reductase [Methylomonas sp. UP202]WGS83898.1 alkene reductase [Methylomonas sp. UP202]